MYETQRHRDTVPHADGKLCHRKVLMARPGMPIQRKRRSTWQPAEIEVLSKLHKDGASLDKICAHFPTRSSRSVYSALHRHGSGPEKPSNANRIWSQEDKRSLTELVLQGAGAHEIAKALHRSARSIWKMAWKIGVQFPSRARTFSTEEKERLQQMRLDGATFKTIAATLGRPINAVFYQWSCLKTNHYPSTRPNRPLFHPHTQLSLDDYQTIRSLREQAASWSSIGSLFPQYQLDSIKQDFWRFTKRKLSATDMRTIQNLRQEGKSWKAIVDTGDYSMTSQDGLREAFERTLRNKAEE